MNRVKSTILEKCQIRRYRTTFYVVSSVLPCFLLAGCIASAPLAPLELNDQDISAQNLSQSSVLGPDSVEAIAHGDPENAPKPITALSHTAQNDDIPAALQTQVTPLERPVNDLANGETLIEASGSDISQKPSDTNVASVRPSIFQRLFNRTATQQQPNGKVQSKKAIKQRKEANSSALFTSLVSDTDDQQSTKDQATSDNELPGVKNESLFDKIFDSNNNTKSKNAPVSVASAAGFAKISPSGLVRQHEGVRVNCFKPELMKILKRVERHYGKKVIVTSGYRSPTANRRAGGARNSMHIYCSAADIQVSGVSKWRLAKYLRSLSNRGGIGTYCHTKSVHVDIGTKRDWNRKCRRAKRRRG